MSATGSKSMWSRSAKLLTWLLFLLVPVFWTRFDAIGWILVPLVSLVCLLVAQGYIAKRWSYAPVLNSALASLVLAFNLALGIWPDTATEVRWDLERLWRTKSSLDSSITHQIDPAVIRARDFLRTYATAASDWEDRQLAEELDELAQRAREGKLTLEDKKLEKQLLKRYNERRKRTKQTATGGPPTSRSISVSSGPGGASSAAPATGAGVAAPNSGQVRDESRAQWISDFQGILNPDSLKPGERNIAIAIESFGSAAGLRPDQEFYAHLRVDGARLVTNLFGRDFVTRGFFADLYGGDQGLLRLAADVSRADLIILGRMNSVFHRGIPAAGDRVSCEVMLQCKVIGGDGAIIKTGTLRVLGPPLSPELALDRAVDLLADQFSERILKPTL